MKNRRDFLKLTGLAAIGALVSACEQPTRLAYLFGHSAGHMPEPGTWHGSPAERAAAHVLKRLTYGPRSGDIAQVAEMGIENFIEQQLAPQSITDEQAFWLVRRIETLNLRAPEMFDFPAEEIITEVRRGTVLRAVYSERQLLEVMVEFWSDHFNIFAGKSDCGWLKVVDDREVIRPHALGKFRDLLRASATSPAMLVYLDGRANVKGKPNENYARELMELHTLGVEGGYTQTDVGEVARALTGWRVRERFHRGQAFFDPGTHDTSPKIVLGQEISNDSESEIDRIIGIVSTHPATAPFVCAKLCRRFVSDNPTPELVAQVAGRFRETDGDISETLRTMFRSPEFLTAPPKFKRPYTYAMSALRALGASSDGTHPLQEHLRLMGQLPYNWPTPDGYPDGASHWQAQLLSRWNFAYDLASGRIKGTTIDLGSQANTPTEVAPSLLQRDLTEPERKTLGTAANPDEALALLLCMPDFQFQ